MNALKKIVLGVALAGAAFVVVGLLLPRTAQVERSTVIDAPRATVFTVLNGFRQFGKWSPWAGIDPNATTTIEGPAVGVGAKLGWSGNADVGSGTQEIVESVPYERIALRLGFGDFPGTFGARFELGDAGGGTRVTWVFEADYGGSILGRWFGLLADRMVGPDYEKGLAQLKGLVEQLPRADFSSLKVVAVETTADPVVQLSVRSADNPNAIGVALGVAYSRLSGYINVAGLQQTAGPIAIFRGAEQGTLTLDAAIPVDRGDAAPTGQVRLAHLPAGPALRAEYQGAYAGLAAARAQMVAYLAAAGIEPAGPTWEQYVSDPARTPEPQLVTHIYVPVRAL